jgi:hypothetical protein
VGWIGFGAWIAILLVLIAAGGVMYYWSSENFKKKVDSSRINLFYEMHLKK